MNVYGLIGYPLGHSFSKKYFSDKFEREGLTNNRYELFPIEKIENINQILKEQSDLKGLNVTIPYKQVVLKYLHDSSNIPDNLRACNCIKIVDGKTYGYNTDVLGFEKTLLSKIKSFQDKALILGNGGATEAVKYVFDKHAIQYEILSRSLHEGSTMTYNDLTDEILAAHHIIVNTTPLGMHPDINNCANIPYHAAGPNHHFYDLVYNPEKTLFLRKGEERGASIQNGYEMLLIQAEESWNIWAS